MKYYTVQFGSGNPQGLTGLAPTFLSFVNLVTGTTNTPPSIAETITGKTGLYVFQYGVTQPMSFLIDAATTSPGTSARYVTGQLDPVDRADEYGTTLQAFSATLTAQLTNTGSTLTGIGNTQFAYGSSLVAIGVSLTAFGVTTGANFTNLGSTLVGIGNTQFAFGQSNIATGNTLIALGQSSMVFSFLGSTASSMGSTGIDPTTVMGFLIRAQEIREGNNTYTKATGILDLFTRGGTLLREKTIADSSTSTTKT